MVMKAMRYGASNKITKTILFGILLLATIGLAFSGGGGSWDIRGISGTDVAKIGNDKISMATFDRSLRRMLARLNIEPSDAYKAGYVDQFLVSEIRSRIMAKAAEENGIAIDRKRIAEQIRAMVAPMTAEGQKPGDVFRQILMSQGISEAEFVQSIENEMATGLLANTIENAFSNVPDDLARDLYLAQNEKRDVQYIVFPNKDVAKLPEAPEESLRELYDLTKENFSIPETRFLQLLKIDDAALKKTVEITEEDLKESYESDKDNFYTPASHQFEESLFDSEDHAQKVHAQVKSGASLLNAVKDVTGKAIAYLGEKTVEDKDLAAEYKDQVAAMTKPGLLPAPVKTLLGWHVIVVKKAIPEGTRPFAEVKEELSAELYETRLSDAKYELASGIDDLVASGSTPEDIAKQADIEIVTLPSINQYGQNGKGEDALKTYEKSSRAILENGFKLSENETSPVSEMADGSFLAIHVKSITPKSYRPFEDVKKDLQAQWIQDQARIENKTRVANYLSALQNKSKSLADIAKESKKQIQKLQNFGRDGHFPPALGPQFKDYIFNAKEGEGFSTDTTDGQVLALVTDVNWPDTVDVESQSFKQFKDSLILETRNEAIMTYLKNKNQKYKTKVNEGLLRRTYGTSQQQNF